MSETEQANRLKDFERVSELLWPAVRFFGLCGADPRYVAAVAELGVLLGKAKSLGEAEGPTGDTIAKARAEQRRADFAEIANYIEQTGEIRSRIGRGNSADIAEIVRGLASK
jgi:hypothetical protein